MCSAIKCAWHPEYGSWMVEATPGAPFGDETSDLRTVERNMAFRRARIRAAAAAVTGPGAVVVPFSIVAYPLMGVAGDFTSPAARPPGPFAVSAYVPDECISPHPRFGTLTANIRHRRGRKVEIQVPLFMDEHTALTEAASAATAAAAVVVRGGQQQQAPPSSSSGPAATHPLDLRVTTATAHIDRVRGVLAAAAAAAAASSTLSSTLSPSLSSSAPAHVSALSDESTAAMDVAEATVAVGGPPAERAATASSFDVGASTIPVPGYIHMDAMAFGMGCCCLQVTFQARDLAESRYLYDSLAILSPLMMALTANSAIWRGRLADTDTRWNVIEASVDCRTPAERGGISHGEPTPDWQSSANAGQAAGAGGERHISKSRYSSIDCFISVPSGDDPEGAGASGCGGVGGGSRAAKAAYSDLPLQFDAEAFAALAAGGVDDTLARHIAHLFIRDPMVVFSDRVVVDDARTTEHFENIQSTNWRSVRWKPPPPEETATPAPPGGPHGGGMGWRVELRTMEAQLTDFENAAFTVFTVLLSRVMLFFDLNLYVPLSLVDANFDRARARNAVATQRFFFRRNILHPCTTAEAPVPAPSSTGSSSAVPACAVPLSPAGVDEDAVDELTLAEILLGTKRGRASSSSFSASAPAAQTNGSAAAAGGGGEGGAIRSRASTDGNDGLTSPVSPGLEVGAGTTSAATSGGGVLPMASPPGGTSSSTFPGLIPLLFVYLDLIECDDATRATIDQ